MALSGQITVTAAGTEVTGPNQAGSVFALKAHPDNTDVVWVGSDDGAAPAVSSSTGFPLNPGETLVIRLANLNRLLVDADANGSKLCWIRLE